MASYQSALAFPEAEHEISKGQCESPTRTGSKFRFKSKRKSEQGDGHARSHNRHRKKEREYREERKSDRHQGSKRRCPSKPHSEVCPAADDDIYVADDSSEQYLDPESAFRESLFDAMADDEGADYWQAVYGQPVHIYPNVKESPEGELERMTDEEYTAYVRARMYEKTHQYMMEEKTRRDAAKKERDRIAKQGREAEKAAQKFRIEVEESLKRGRERKNRKSWTDRWDAYVEKWEELGRGTSVKITIASIPWPVESGKRQDIEVREIKRFFLYGSSGGNPTEMTLAKVLKSERVRWHPDKMQQKLGGQGVDDAVVQGVTEVFQIIDRLWSELRSQP